MGKACPGAERGGGHEVTLSSAIQVDSRNWISWMPDQVRHDGNMCMYATHFTLGPWPFIIHYSLFTLGPPHRWGKEKGSFNPWGLFMINGHHVRVLILP